MIIDFTDVAKGQAPAAIGRALHFPDWFGGTWDSVQDCLRAHCGKQLTVRGLRQWQRRDPHGHAIFTQILKDLRITLNELPEFS